MTRDEPEVQRALGSPRKRRRNPLADDDLVDESSIEELALQLAADMPSSDLGGQTLFRGSR